MLRTKQVVVIAVLSTLVVAPLAAQTPPKGGDQLTEVEMSRLVRELDGLLDHARAAEASARAAIEQAQRAQTQASDVEKDRAAWIAHDLQDELSVLHAALKDHLAKLGTLREQAVARSGSPASDPLAQVRAKILEAQKLPTLANAEEALKAVIKDLQSDKWKKVAGADQMLGFAHFRLAGTLQQMAVVQQELNRWRAVQVLVDRSSREYSETLNSPDSANSGEGSSLHAVALLRKLNIELSLYDYMRELLRTDPSSEAVRSTMNQHKASAVSALDRLRRQFADATLPDGKSIVEAANTEVARRKR